MSDAKILLFPVGSRDAIAFRGKAPSQPSAILPKVETVAQSPTRRPLGLASFGFGFFGDQIHATHNGKEMPAVEALLELTAMVHAAIDAREAREERENLAASTPHGLL